MSHPLETQLRENGVACRVEAHDRLAILVPDHESAVHLTAADRQRILKTAREHGFSHVSLELEPDVAALPRD